MRGRLALALLFVAACTHPSPVAADAVDAAAGSSVADGANAVLDAAPATPDASALELATDGGLAAVLSGEVSASRLPEVATDRGEPLDRVLRERLTTREAVPSDSLAAVGTAGDEVNVTVKSVSATSPMADADRIVASTRPRARLCYRMGVASDPTMKGDLVLAATVGSNGEVGDARIVKNIGLSTQVAGCVARAYKNATFAPPAGGAGATLTIALSFASGYR